MRTWVKWTALATVGLLASSAIAADHGDPSPVMDPADGTDISDVYAWMSDTDKLTMILTTPAPALSNAAYYVFHIGRQADAFTAATAASTSANTTQVICWYGTNDETTCVVDQGTGQTIDYVQGVALTEVTNSEQTMRVHVGAHADPFYFYLTGFIQARAEVLDLVARADVLTTFTPEGCPDTNVAHPDGGMGLFPVAADVDQVLRGILVGSYTDTGVAATPGNDLAASNVTGLVLELDTSLLAGDGDHYQVWASTHEM